MTDNDCIEIVIQQTPNTAPKTFIAADYHSSVVAELRAQVATLAKERDEAQAENASRRIQRETFVGALDDARTIIATLTTERDQCAARMCELRIERDEALQEARCAIVDRDEAWEDRDEAKQETAMLRRQDNEGWALKEAVATITVRDEKIAMLTKERAILDELVDILFHTNDKTLDHLVRARRSASAWKRWAKKHWDDMASVDYGIMRNRLEKSRATIDLHAAAFDAAFWAIHAHAIRGCEHCDGPLKLIAPHVSAGEREQVTAVMTALYHEVPQKQE